MGPASQLGLGLDQVDEVTFPGEGKGGGAAGVAAADDGHARGRPAREELPFEELLAAAEGEQFFPAGQLDGALENVELPAPDLFQQVPVDLRHEEGGRKMGAVGFR